jgi:pSer/pThr/pTyr-binding forkhead associated (FHA) protein
MPDLTFQVLDGVDKGRVFRNLPTPITMGREEGNMLRLNDERVSRYHAKVQSDNGEVILTDLDSTNGTRVNGNVVQIRRLRVGDRISIGRSTLLFGSEAEIRQRIEAMTSNATSMSHSAPNSLPGTVIANTVAGDVPDNLDMDLIHPNMELSEAQGNLFMGNHPLPPLPQRMTPSQAARLAELLDFLHRQVVIATENVQANEDVTQVCLGYIDWQRIQMAQMLLARYVRGVAEPDILEQ